MSRLLNLDEVQEFKKKTDGYEPNNEVLEQFKSSNFGIIAGPAGAGKDTLRDELINKYPESYLPILSTTTRPPRAGEVDGKTYHFWEVERVAQGLDKKEFFQAELVHNQQVSCLHVDEVRKLKPGQWGLSILIPITEKALSNIKSDIKTIFLIPPTVELLMERIQSERLLNNAEIDRRLEAAKKEIAYAMGAKHYYCVISDTVENVTRKAHKFFSDGEIERIENTKARAVLQKIMLELS